MEANNFRWRAKRRRLDPARRAACPNNSFRRRRRFALPNVSVTRSRFRRRYADHRRWPRLGCDRRRVGTAEPLRRNRTRIADFARLVSTAIANAETRAELVLLEFASSPRPIKRDNVSSVTSTMAHNSKSFRSASNFVLPRRGGTRPARTTTTISLVRDGLECHRSRTQGAIARDTPADSVQRRPRPGDKGTGPPLSVPVGSWSWT